MSHLPFSDSNNADEEEKEHLLSSSDKKEAEEDDDFFLHGPGKPNFETPKPDTLSQAKNKVQEVTDVMRDNISRLLERGDRLDDLYNRSENLNVASDNFRASAVRVQRRAWCSNVRIKACWAAFIVLVILIIIVPIIIKQAGN